MVKDIILDSSKKTKEKQQTHYAEISLSVRVDTTLDLEKIKSLYGQGGVEIQIKLKSFDNKDQVTPEVLEVWSVDWEDWDEL